MRPNFKSTSIGVLALVTFALLVFQSWVIAQDKVSQIDELVKLYQKYEGFNGTVLVAEGGKVIFKNAYGVANVEWNIPHKPDTKFRLGSITKQFTSMLIMQLVNEGKITLDGKLSDYLPYYRKDTGEKVSVHHLLIHNSGIPSYTSRPDFFQDISRDPYSVEEFVKKYCSDDFEFEPGKRFSYNNSGYFLLGAIIEEVTGKTYEEALEERIFKPLGMKDTGYDHHETILPNRATGYNLTLDGFENSPYLDMSLPYAAGSLYSTVEDLYIWDQALYTEKLLPDKLKEVMFQPHVKAGGGNYAYGWFISEKKVTGSEEKKRHISHGGGINGFNTLIDRQVTDRNLVVLLNSAPGASLGNLSQGIFNIIYGKPYKKPVKPISVTLYQTIKKKDVDTAVAQYEDLKKTHPKDYNFQPMELVRLGNHLMNKTKDIDGAIKILKLNAKINPKFSYTYVSLADAYMKKDQKNQAVKNYAKALELNPGNKNILDLLNKAAKEE
jgi:CubicO group peptidase (beta-lactamase class C family)